MVDASVIPPGAVSESVAAAVIGAGAGIIAALAATITALWRYYSKRQGIAENKHADEREAWAKERVAWAAERTRLEGFRDQLRAEYEAKHTQSATHYAESIRALYESTLEHENAARREYAENIEAVSKTVTESVDKTTAVIDKFYDRFVGPRRHQRD